MLKLKLSVIALACLLIANTGFAQKNVIKVRPLMPVASIAMGGPVIIPLAYERVLIPRLTAQIGLSYGLKKQLDTPFDFGDVTMPTIKSIGFSPEVRFYPRVAKETPRGLYFNAYFKYSRTTLETDYTYKQDLDFNGVMIPYSSKLEATGKVSLMNYGIGMGSQWLIADRVSIDILWLGLGWGGATIGLDLEGKLVDPAVINAQLVAKGAPPMTPAEQASLPNWKTIENAFGDGLELPDVPVVSPTLTTSSSNNGIGAEIKANVPSLRLFNFSIGFAF
jgi:hypothetical protein